MNRATILIASVVLVSMATVTQAGLYVGVGGGVVHLDPEVEAGMVIEDDGRDGGYRAVIGKRFGSKLGVELFYTSLGSATFSPTGEVDFSAYGVNTVWDVMPAKHGSARPSVFVSLGAGVLDTDVDGASVNRDDDNLIIAGIGARVQLRHGLSLNTTVEMYDRDATMASLMLVKEFARGGAKHHSHAKYNKHCRRHGKIKQNVASIAAPKVTASAVSAAVLPELKPASKSDQQQIQNLAQLENVYFNSDSAFITEMGETVLEQMLKTMKDYPEMRLEIQGHSDKAEGGSGRALSELRAQRVSNYLWQQGITPDRFSLIAYGDSQPAADEKGSRLNRRVQFRILSVN